MLERPIENCYWVVPGKLLAGEYPRNKDDDSSPEKLARLTEAGVSVFVDLTKQGELSPYKQWLTGASHQRFPITDGSVPSSAEQTIAILDTIDSFIVEDLIVYVHCWGGIGRTGTIVGCWLARHGESGRAALERLRKLWRQCPKSTTGQPTPETPNQEQYVLKWQESR